MCQKCGAFVVCGFLIKDMNAENMIEKSWESFGSTANPAHFHSNWAGWAVLFSR